MAFLFYMYAMLCKDDPKSKGSNSNSDSLSEYLGYFNSY